LPRSSNSLFEFQSEVRILNPGDNQKHKAWASQEPTGPPRKEQAPSFIHFLTKENKITFLKGGEGRRGKQGKIILPFPIFTGQINIKSPTSDGECGVKMISSVLSSCPFSMLKCQQEVYCAEDIFRVL
jgi:hypothetical protein